MLLFISGVHYAVVLTAVLYSPLCTAPSLQIVATSTLFHSPVLQNQCTNWERESTSYSDAKNVQKIEKAHIVLK